MENLEEEIFMVKSESSNQIYHYMIQIVYIHCEYDCCGYVRVLEDSYIFLLLYVDNMLIPAKSMYKVDMLKSLLHRV